QLLHRGARAGAGVADVEPLALEVVEALDVRLLPGNDGERLRMHGEDRAQRLVGLGIRELPLAVIGVVLHVRLHHAEIEFAGANGVDVEHRAAGRFHRAADAVLLAGGVDQPADGTARGVVHAGDATGADRDELLLLGNGGGPARSDRDTGRDDRRSAGKKDSIHDVAPSFAAWIHNSPGPRTTEARASQTDADSSALAAAASASLRPSSAAAAATWATRAALSGAVRPSASCVLFSKPTRTWPPSAAAASAQAFSHGPKAQ